MVKFQISPENHRVIGVNGKHNIARESYRGIINEIEFVNSTLKNEKVHSEESLSKRFGLDFF